MTRLWWFIVIGLVVSVAADALLVGADVPGYPAVFALVGCVLIIIVSKWLGRFLLQRQEEYYEERSGG